jgi:peptidoglycan/LPS O-acetylase OafA/YrhL
LKQVDIPLAKVAEANLTSHIGVLDGLRAVAIISVMLVHAGAPGFEAGWVGVDLFFALSGFLITTLLLKEYARYGYISFGSFLYRRLLRLMPAYVLYLLVISYAMWWWPGSVMQIHSGWSPKAFFVALWTYTINFAPMGGIWNGQVITIHLWSLSVEQQYYLVWPIVVAAITYRPRLLLIISLLLSLLGVLLFWLANPYSTMLYTRGFTLIFGSCVAIVAYILPQWMETRWWHYTCYFSLLVIPVAFALSARGIWTEGDVRHFLLPSMSLGFALLVALLWYQANIRNALRWLSHPWLMYLGKISYGMYLYHELARVMVWHYTKPLMVAWSPALGYGTRILLYAALTTAVSASSFRWVESYFLSIKTAARPHERLQAKDLNNAK